MGAPHNKKRYGELWPSYRIQYGHLEYKHAHDHKDIDLFVDPKNVASVMYILQENDFQKVWTRYDQLPSEKNNIYG